MVDQGLQPFDAGFLALGANHPMGCCMAIPRSLRLKEFPRGRVLAEIRFHLLIEGAIAVLV
jgi:hypothetical protein